MTRQGRSLTAEPESSSVVQQAAELGPAPQSAASGHGPLLGGRLGSKVASAGWPPGDGAASLAGLTHATGGGHRAAFAHELQRQLGNQAVLGAVQTKLTLGRPGDAYEQEADRIAAAAVRMKHSPNRTAPT
jgi:hypothetical protein